VSYTTDLTAYPNLYLVEVGSFHELPDLERPGVQAQVFQSPTVCQKPASCDIMVTETTKAQHCFRA
jgi:hypothetical protein